MSKSSNFRARRPPSPPPSSKLVSKTLDGDYPLQTSQRFPHAREDHLDADARLKQAKLEPRGALRRQQQSSFGGIKMSSLEWKVLFLTSLLAVGVRVYQISHPDSVVFDEVHFGKFASKYIKTQYFVDVHPPLAKLLITLVAFVFRYDGQFDFKEIGKIYENVPYVAMRMLPAILGVALVPISYLTLRALDCRASTAILGSLFITFENGLITQSRHILLDSPLVFFTGLTTFLWVGFTNENRRKPFTEAWWLWLTLSGLSLGAVVSCKWVGLFTIATVGCSTIRQLWILLGDLKVSPRMWMKHFLARALCLIIVPMLFYMAMFEIHFLILENSGDGDGFMSSEFQHTLGGRHMSDTFADVALGSTINIRHWNTQGGYLHSHPHNYPTGSKQQQITLYPHRDSNNDWRVTNVTREGEAAFDWTSSPLEYIYDRTELRLEHITTQKRLHSHDFRPPMSEQDFQNEVSAYGFEGFAGDANDHWILEIYNGDKKDKESHKRVKTLRTKFRLRHTLTGCYLFSHKVKLPDWGWEQQEVTCNKNAPKDNSLWVVETNVHPQLDERAPKVNYRLPGFLSKFIELQQVMWTTNAGLTDRHTFDSRPSHWPGLRRGINFWVKDHRQIYLLGNPWVWWLSTAAVATYIVVRGFLILRAKRGYKDFNNSNYVKYDELCGFLFIGWSLHYFPFYLMARQLFLHHYFPALYFAILLFCAVFDILTTSLRTKYRLQLVAAFIAIAILNYAHFIPLTYGTPWTRGACQKSQWLRTWDFACTDFYDEYSKYSTASNILPSVSPLVTIGGEDGRAPVIVVDDARMGAQKQEPATSVVPNQPAPGPDIFENSDGQQAQSIDVPQPQQEQHEVTNNDYRSAEKIIPQPPPRPQEPEPQKEEKSDEKDVEKDATHGGSEKDTKENAAEASGSKLAKENVQHSTTDGPRDEAMAERDRVMEELFGKDG